MRILKEAVRFPAESVLKVYLDSLSEPEFEPKKVERILVFAYHGLGNFIMYTPALRLLRERYPNARIDLQVGNNTGCEDVLEGAGLFDNIYNLPYSAGLRAWINRARAIRDTQYDLTLSEFHSHSWPLTLLIAASGARFRAGHVTSPGWSTRFSRYSFAFNLPVTMRRSSVYLPWRGRPSVCAKLSPEWRRLRYRRRHDHWFSTGNVTGHAMEAMAY